MKRASILMIVILLLSVPLQSKVLDPSAPIGSRKNPVPVGEWLIFSTGEQQIAVMVTGIIAGQKAAEMLASGNQFFSGPTESQEYYIVGIQAQHLKDLTGSDKPFTISRFNWKLADEKYTILNKFDIIMLGDAELKATMYEGGDTFGALAYIVDKGKGYYAVYDQYWFDLSSPTTVR